MNFAKQFPILLTLCLISFCTNAQNLEYFSNNDYINHLFFDEDRIWVATNGGILELSMDATLIKKHTILDGLFYTDFQAIKRDDEGRLCAIRPYGGGLFYYKNNQWKRDKWLEGKGFTKIIHSNGLLGYVEVYNQKVFFKANKKWKRYKYKSEETNLYNAAVYDNKGHLWIGTSKGVVRLHKKTSKIYKFADKSYGADYLLKDKNGILWALDQNRNWYLYAPEKDTWEICDSEQCMKILKSPVRFTDTKGNLWFANEAGNLLYQYNGSDWKEIEVPLAKVPNGWRHKNGLDKVITMAEDKTGNLWLASHNGNLYKYNGSTWQTFNILEKGGYFDHRAMDISSVSKDSKGNLWLGRKNGVAYYDLEQDKNDFWDREAFQIRNYKSISPESFIEDEQGNIYTNTNQGVYKYNNKKIEWLPIQIDEEIQSIYYDKEEKAITYVTESGMLMKELSSGAIYYEKLAGAKEDNDDNEFKAIHWDAKGGVWIAFNEKLHYSTNEKTRVFDLSNSPINKERSDFIFEDSKGRIWTNTKRGLAYWDGDSWTAFNKKNGLSEGVLVLYGIKNMPIAEDKDGNLLVRAYGSISRWDGKTWTKTKQWNKYLSYQGNLYIDKMGILWLLERGKGIVRCDGSQCTEVLSANVVISDVIEDHQGRIWFFTQSQGIFRYTPDNAPQN